MFPSYREPDSSSRSNDHRQHRQSVSRTHLRRTPSRTHSGSRRLSDMDDEQEHVVHARGISTNLVWSPPPRGFLLGTRSRDHLTTCYVEAKTFVVWETNRKPSIVISAVSFKHKLQSCQISTVLVNITPDNAKGLTLTSKAKVSNEHWGPHSSEQSVIFVDGELLCGVLDKSQFGATSYGLVHAVYELYGADTAGRLLSILSRLFTKFLQHRAFTCRMDDLALTPEGEKTRRSELEKAKSYGTEAAIDNFPSLSDPNISKADIPDLLAARLEEVLRDDTKMAGLDYTVKMKVNGLTKTIEDKCMPHGLLRRFPDNHMQTMVMTGAKGSNVNARQISCGLGQQELEGRRVPVMVSGKTLPSFKAFETAAVAGGYVASRFLTGLRPQEFYFHCMAGREGLIDTAVKTSRSGYLQRCLIKHLEGIRVHYDHTVRGSDSSIYQFHYGGDGLDVTKQKYLLGDVPKNPSKLDAKQQQLFEFTVRNIDSVINKTRPKDIKGIVDDEEATAYMKKLLKKPMSQRTKPPALSEYIPSRYLGSTSERFAQAVDDYVTQNPDRLIRSKKDKDVQPLHRMAIPVAKFRTIMNIRYLRALVEPGEAVGLLASQGCVLLFSAGV
jgi:hypothetical protein